MPAPIPFSNVALREYSAYMQSRFNRTLPRFAAVLTVLIGIVGLKSDVLGQG